MRTAFWASLTKNPSRRLYFFALARFSAGHGNQEIEDELKALLKPTDAGDNKAKCDFDDDFGDLVGIPDPVPDSDDSRRRG